jgi:nicotinamide mononucleotide transporter
MRAQGLAIWAVAVLASVALAVGSWTGALPFTREESLAFITGALCVWLVVRQNIWNFPIGILNNLFFIVVFFQVRLFADMGLQVVYIGLAFMGWYLWLYGGENRTVLKVHRVSRRELAILGMLSVAGTYGLLVLLTALKGSVPFLDALTTMLSLVAQYMLNRKYLENWLVWITADVIYIGLYAYKQLYLTAALYAIFLCLCVVGYRDWRRSLLNSNEAPLEAVHA